MTERKRFVVEAQGGLFSHTELCRRHNISRLTGYKWLERYEAEGPDGLTRPLPPASFLPPCHRDLRARGCLRTPQDPAPVGCRQDLGPPGNLTPRLVPAHAPDPAQAFRSAGACQKAAPGVATRPHPGKPTATFEAPNSIWSADFKGHFKARDGIYCYPLTVHDGFSRYLLACQGLSGTTYAGSRRVFTRLFQEFGLPQRIRSDNGTPFASTALGRLSRLSVWCIKLGILPDLIEPRLPSPKRPSRTHAQRPQGRGHDTSGRATGVCSAAPLQCLPS